VAQAEAHQARLLPNPVLNVAVRFAEGGGSPTIEASVAADLLALLRRPGAVSAADRRLRAATADALTEVLAVWRDVQQRYTEVQAAETRINQLREATTAIDRFLTRARARLDRGEATRLDVSALAAQRLDFQQQVLEAQSQLRTERLRLARLIGAPSEAADWALEPLAVAAIPPVPEAVLIRAGLDHRPEIQATLWELAALGSEARLARWYLTDGIEPGVDSERDGEWTVGPSISVPIPIFDWGQARRERVDALVWQSRHELLGRRRQVVEETRVAHATVVMSGEAARRIRDELIPLQQQRREDTEAAFAAGQADVTALLLAERDLQDARARLSDLERKTQLAVIDLQWAVGGPAVLSAAGPGGTPSTQPTVPIAPRTPQP
jgi:outer membrane protein TolC